MGETAPTAADNQTVFIKTEDGHIIQGPRKSLAQALSSTGGDEVTGEDVAKARLQAKYGGAGGQLAAGAISAGDALTLGLGTGVAGLLGGEGVKEYIRDVEAANPISSGLGTALGLVAPAFFTGGASLAEEGGGLLARGAELATMPARLLGEAGEATAQGVSGALGQGALGRLGGGAARGALEGAVYGAGSQLSEDVLGDHELTAERLLAGAGRGALLGGGLGLGLATLGLGGTHIATATNASTSGITDSIQKRAAEMQFAATGARTPEIREVRAHGLDTDEVGRWMLDEMPAHAEGGKAPITREGILQAANGAADEAGGKIAGHIDVLDRSGFKLNYQPILDRLRSELVEPLGQKLGMKPVAQRIDDLVNQAQGRLEANPSFRELHTLQEELDDLAWRDRKVFDQSNATGEIRKARAMLAEEFKKQGEMALGTPWRSGYEASNRQMRMALTVKRATEAADARIAGNHGISLSDKIIGAHGLVALALGNPGVALAAIGAAGVNHLLTKYGNAVGSRMLDKFSSLQAVSDMSRELGHRTADTVAGAISGAETAATGGLVRLAHGYDKRKEEIDQLANNPELLTAAISPHLPAAAAPKTSAIMAQRMASAVAYLKATMPPGTITGGTLTPQIKQQPSKLMQREWMSRVDVWENPLHVLDAMRKNMLTPAKADALKTMYPAIFKDIQQAMVSMIATKAAKGHEVPYSKRVQMGVLFGAVTDATLAPDFVQSQQGIYGQGASAAAHPEQAQAASPLAQRAPATNAKTNMSYAEDIGTEAQRLEDNRGAA